MADSTTPYPSSVKLDDLIALNDEIAASIRAGIPLEVGLHGFPGSASGRLAAISAHLAQRLSRGEPLTEALAAERGGFPRVYRAVVEAGLRAGRLPEALESLSGFARSMLEIRQQIALALIYPVIVVISAYYLFWFFIGYLASAMEEVIRMSGTEPAGWLPWVKGAFEMVEVLGHLPPILLLGLLAWWLIAGRLLFPSSGPVSAGLKWVPGAGLIYRRFHLAGFAELSAVLLEQDVPLHESLVLAAEATGDPRIIGDAGRLAESARQGRPLAETVSSASSLPPFMRWMIAAGARHGTLPASLRQIAEIYRRRALFRAEWFKLCLPVVLTLAVGGAAVLLYVLALFVPLTELLKNLAAG